MVRIEGRFHIPEGTPRPEIIPPDEVILATARACGLMYPGMKGIDPLAGTGTIPRVINSAGGNCIGIERDPEHYAIAQRETPPGTTIVLGDCTEVYLPQFKVGLDYIYTSPTFDRPEEMRKIAAAFGRMLRRGGSVVIDSADEVIRHGVVVRPVFTAAGIMAEYGFNLRAEWRFQTEGQDGTDGQFTELEFTRLW